MSPLCIQNGLSLPGHFNTSFLQRNYTKYNHANHDNEGEVRPVQMEDWVVEWLEVQVA
jgi:hypothetical protein